MRLSSFTPRLAMYFFACPACRRADSADAPPDTPPACPGCGTPVPVSAATVGPPPADLARLLDTLTRLPLLPRSAAIDLAAGVGDYPTPAALTGELARLGWLSPWQAERVRDGKADALVLGQYVLLDRLGAGGMGEVFKARHALMDRLVALKTMRGGDLERFRREIRGLSKLSHPNVLVAHDAGEANGTLFLVTEFVPGIDLARAVAERGPLPYAEARELARQAAVALAHVHAAGLVHRDVKPHNLMATRDDNGRPVVKLLDLGLVRLREDDGLTADGALMGTLDYLAPEQAEDARHADIRADLYSLGCTLYFLLVGRPPFEGGSITEKISRHREREAVPVEKHRPDCPPALAAAVRRLMAKRPADRFQTPAEAADALAPPPGDTAATEPYAETPRPPAPRRAWVVPPAVAVALLVAAALAWRFWPAATPTPPDPGPVAKERPRPDKVGELFRFKAARFWLSATGRGLCMGDDGARVVDLFDGKEVGRLGPAGWGMISPDGKRAFLADNGLPFKCRLMNVESGEQEWDFDGQRPEMFVGAFSSDGKRFAAAGGDHVVIVYDLAARKAVARLVGHAGKVTGVAFGLNDTRLITCARDDTVRLWDVAASKQIASEPGYLPSGFDTHNVSTGRAWGVIHGKDGLHVRSLDGWKKLFPFQNTHMLARFSADDSRIASHGAATLCLWDARGGRLREIWSKAGNTHSAAISPDGKRALTGHRLGEVHLWTLDGDAGPVILKGHEWSVNQSEFLDGHRAVTHSADGVVIVWGLP